MKPRNASMTCASWPAIERERSRITSNLTLDTGRPGRPFSRNDADGGCSLQIRISIAYSSSDVLSTPNIPRSSGPTKTEGGTAPGAADVFAFAFAPFPFSFTRFSNQAVGSAGRHALAAGGLRPLLFRAAGF